MDKVDEIPQAVFIGIAVASVLLQTHRYSKAIELFGECLVLLKKRSSKLKEDNLNKLYGLVHRRLFYLFCLVGDYKNAIHIGEAISTLNKIDFVELFEIMGDLYQLPGELVKAKDLYGTPGIQLKEHLNTIRMVTTKIGDKEREGWLLNQLGKVSLSLFEYSKAKEYFEKELAIWRETGNRKKEGWALCCLGNVYKTMEEYQQAKQHLEKAMVILEDAGELKQLGEVYSVLGRVYRNLREFHKAKLLLMKALEISVKSGNKEDEMSDHRHLAGIHASMGEYDEAKECYQKALAVSRELNDVKEEASTYSDLAVFYRERNDFEKAEDYCKKAREIYKEVGDLSNEGSENRELGDLYCFLGKYHEGRKCHERALAIKKQIGDRKGEADSYCDLANVYDSLGDYSKVKDCFEQALAISKETNHLRGQGVDYGNLGAICQYLGDYNTAYEYHKKALEIRLRTGHIEGLPAAYNHLGGVCQHLGEYVKAGKFYKKALASAKEIGDRRSEATILSSLASLESAIGEFENAVGYYEEALQNSKEVGDIKLEAETNSSFGTVYRYLGDFTTAKKYFEESLAIMKRIGSRGGEGNALASLGDLYFSLGEFAQARKCDEQALEISRETGNKKGEMIINNNLGSLNLSQYEFHKALECFERALGISVQMGDLHGKSTSQCNIAMVYMVCKETPKALSYLHECIKSLEEMRGSIGESEHFKIGFSDKNVTSYQLMIIVLLKLGYEDKALSVLELTRGRSLAELMATQYFCQHLPDFDRNRWIDFANVIQWKSCTCLSLCLLHAHFLFWILKAGRKIMFKEVVSKMGQSIVSRDASAQSCIDKLVGQAVRMFTGVSGKQCEDRSLHFLYGPQAVEPQVAENLANLRLIEEDSDEENNEGREPASLKLLYNMLVSPVADRLEASEILIVPDRSLFKVPFAALMDESGEYLSEKYIIRFAPSLTTLKFIQDSPADYHSGTGALIVGDPDVGTVRHQGRKVFISRLPFAKKEVEMIGQLLDVHPLIGKQANKEKVLQKIHSVGLIHIAAHGDAERGSIALSPSNNEEDDFLLTMSDISKVQLRAKLVVLSCCHSACGQIKAEGVVGIARAFLGSGARSVLVSLWAVDDRATMQFMKQFYGHLVRGKSASRSLHETMKWMRGSPEYSEVRNWAPFMLIGDDVSFDFSK